MTGTKMKQDIDEFVEQVQKEIERREEETYSKRVIREYRSPKNMRRMSSPDAAASVRGSCGDMMEMFLRVRKGRIEDITFLTDGCGPTVASGSVLSQILKGKTLEEASAIRKDDLIDALGGLPDENIHCAELAVNTLRRALSKLSRSSVEGAQHMVAEDHMAAHP